MDYDWNDFDRAHEYDDATDAYRGGKNAYTRGADKADNPFTDRALAYKWNCGYEYAKWEATSI